MSKDSCLSSVRIRIILIAVIVLVWIFAQLRLSSLVSLISRKSSPVHCKDRKEEEDEKFKGSIGFLNIPSVHSDGFTCYDRLIRNYELPRISLGKRKKKHNFYALFFADKEYYDASSDRHFIHLFCGADAFTQFDQSVFLWGPGWPGWNEKISISDNIYAQFHDSLDAIITYFDPRKIGISNVLFITYRHECIFHELGHGDQKRYECKWGSLGSPWQVFHIVLLAYENDYTILQKEREKIEGFDADIEKSLITHWPHAALPGVFLKSLGKNWSEREFDVCLTGNLYKELYPARFLISQWLRDKRLKALGISANILSHMGYADSLSAEERKSKNITGLKLEEQYSKYAEFLSDCKIVIVTRSVRDFELRKYAEGALSGALLMGNIPFSLNQQIWSDIVVNIQDLIDADDFYGFLQMVNSYLSDSTAVEREKRIRNGLFYSYSKRTYQHAWLEVLEAVNKYRSNVRGFVSS
jgi:hypothetical protein